MSKLRPLVATVIVLLIAAPSFAEPPEKAVIWKLDNLESIGGLPVTVVGKPKVIDTDQGKALEFDGQGDAIYLPANPLAELKQFTAEVVFRPTAGGPQQQRFLHFQPDGSEDRVLFETRLFVAGEWFLDTYLQTGAGKHTLFAEKSPHALGPWYAATLTCDGTKLRHYVNGKEELSADVQLTPLAKGQTSIGVRFNKVHWFQGAIRQIRITPSVLEPSQFLKP